MILPLLQEEAAQQEVRWRAVGSQVDGSTESLQGLQDHATLVMDRGKEEVGCGVEPIPCQHSLTEITGRLQMTLVCQSTSMLERRGWVRQTFGLPHRR
jgi:hypothetical protein